MSRPITALAGWFGGNRILAPLVGDELRGCSWVGIPFAGGMAEVGHVDASSILVSDLHRHIINLARVVASPELRPQLLRLLQQKIFHPDELRSAQLPCKDHSPGDEPDLGMAENYFVSCWMGRASKAGITDEFNGRTAARWNANGGSSVIRYRSALRSLALFGEISRRCAFEVMDAFEFIPRCEDNPRNGLYLDPPFPGAGRKYRHNAGKTEAEETAWHTRLAHLVSRFEQTRVVCRFYDHPLIRELYPQARWRWRFLNGAGRNQVNDTEVPEVLLINQPVSLTLFG